MKYVAMLMVLNCVLSAAQEDPIRVYLEGSVVAESISYGSRQPMELKAYTYCALPAFRQHNRFYRALRWYMNTWRGNK